MALQLDAGINYFLWLLGRNHSTTTFRNQYSLSGCPRFLFKGSASITDMWRYIQKEREEGKKLRLEDYSPDFLNWASRYLGRIPADVLASGESLASVAASSVRANMSASHQKRLLSNKHPAIAALTIRAKNVIPEKFNDAKHHPQNTFGSQQGGVENIPFRPLIDELLAPIPLDDLYADRNGVGGSNLDSSLTGDVDLRTCQGSLIDVLKNGDCKIVGCHPGLALRFGTSSAIGDRLRGLAKKPRIYFRENDIQIRAGTDAIYTTPIERLLSTAQGADWLIQLVLERELLQKAPDQKEAAMALKESQTVLGNISFQTPIGGDWRPAELRRRLLLGDVFPCAELKSGGRVQEYRVMFRDVQISVPMTADRGTVFLQAFLTPEGTDHEHKCVTRGEENDPARRLAINVKYKVKDTGGGTKVWWTTRGDCNAKKINSLVDSLEGKDEAWTSSQPRRFLPRSRGRDKVSYTS